MNFQTGTCYCDKVAYSFDRLSQKATTARMKDGRVASFLLYDWLQRRFANLTALDRQPLCLTDGKHIFQVRTVSGSCLTNPHKQNGIKRHWNAVEHAAALHRITHLILIDLNEMPDITFAAIPAAYFFKPDGTPKPKITADLACSMIRHANTLGD